MWHPLRVPRHDGVLAVLTVLWLAAPVAAQDLGPEWKSLTGEEATIIFAAPDLERKIARHLRSTHPRYQYVVEVALWTGPAARHPAALIHYIKTLPGYHLRRDMDPRKFVQSLATFEGKDLDIGRRESHRNKLGRIKSRRFNFENVECVAFTQTFGIFLGDQGEGSDQISGYYCADPGSPLSDTTLSTVVKGVGIKRKDEP